ncbi:MAG TPA: hypothetical protein ENG63_04020 [Candidatus Desulfofervidus auxilii]|uniref:Uncharacterized protein n=1 Tax=Desulfofervidus auxilii TaxID=1621989 RepID=A0A7C0Y9P9_DESA2|nr:hypothetical protein [Candidatus Desulfofervidus auxilii]
MVVKVLFNLINVNQREKKLEIVFPYGKDWYKLDWEKVPEKFKILYVAALKLQGYKVPDYLKEFERDIIEISDVNIEIELDECEKIAFEYPLGF